jgi:hypothetical protein
VDEEEKLIGEFSWPLTGYLMPGAPPLRDLDKQVDKVSTRFRVVKNGSIDVSSASWVCKTEPKSLMKEYFHCVKMTYRQFEFTKFLDDCTCELRLATAARRLFDETGAEIFELTSLKHDQLLFVSCGEAWINPKFVREEQDKKLMVTNLAHDLNKIGFFNKLKVCQELVLETQNALVQEGVAIVLGKRCLTSSQIERIKKGESVQYVMEVDDTAEKKQEEEPK